jgi:hypothetical protein
MADHWRFARLRSSLAEAVLSAGDSLVATTRNPRGGRRSRRSPRQPCAAVHARSGRARARPARPSARLSIGSGLRDQTFGSVDAAIAFGNADGPEGPTYRDFASVAFTIGICHQVSGTRGARSPDPTNSALSRSAVLVVRRGDRWGVYQPRFTVRRACGFAGGARDLGDLMTRNGRRHPGGSRSRGSAGTFQDHESTDSLNSEADPAAPECADCSSLHGRVDVGTVEIDQPARSRSTRCPATRGER